MRMRERSSVERMRMALTEKRDMLGDIVVVEKAMQREKEKEKEEKGAERGGGISSDGWLVWYLIVIILYKVGSCQQSPT